MSQDNIITAVITDYEARLLYYFRQLKPMEQGYIIGTTKAQAAETAVKSTVTAVTPTAILFR